MHEEISGYRSVDQSSFLCTVLLLRNSFRAWIHMCVELGFASARIPQSQRQAKFRIECCKRYHRSIGGSGRLENAENNTAVGTIPRYSFGILCHECVACCRSWLLPRASKQSRRRQRDTTRRKPRHEPRGGEARLVSLDHRTSLPASRDTGARAYMPSACFHLHGGTAPNDGHHRKGPPRNVFRARPAAAERPTSPPVYPELMASGATIDTDDTNTVRLHLPGQTMLGLCFCCYSYSPTLPRFGGTPDTVQLSLIGSVA
jgi:hypothetical protein